MKSIPIIQTVLSILLILSECFVVLKRKIERGNYP